MNPHTSLRRMPNVARWAATVVCVVMVLAWGAGFNWVFGWVDGSGNSVAIQQGAIRIASSDLAKLRRFFSAPAWNPPARGFVAARIGRQGFMWWPGRKTSIPVAFETDLWIPLWMPLALAVVPAALLWLAELRFRKRSRLGCCPACGYDRRGLVGGADAPCPECGKKQSHL